MRTTHRSAVAAGLEVPPAGAEGSVYGQVVDAWQFTIAAVD